MKNNLMRLNALIVSIEHLKANLNDMKSKLNNMGVSDMSDDDIYPLLFKWRYQIELNTTKIAKIISDIDEVLAKKKDQTIDVKIL
jgi:hypothetical protein